MESFAIVLVCFNRIEGLKRLLKSLENADYDNRKDVTLIFSIDNSSTDIVEKYAKNYQWEYGDKIIRTFETRQGLKKHILQCGDYTKEYDVVVVLEDDISVSSSFYRYATQAAKFYENDDNIAGISLYNFQKNWLNWNLRFEPMKEHYDTYFMKIAQSWGQVWTEKKWVKFKEWYLKNKEFEKSDILPQYLNNWPETSWLKYHDKYCIETNRFFVYPYFALSTNNSDVGEHANISCNDYQVDIQCDKKEFLFPVFNENAVKYDEYMNRIGLAKYLGLEEGQLTVDLYGTVRKRLWKEYVLTACKYDGVNCEKTFSLSLRPIELSIMCGRIGEGIYLYKANDIKKKNKSSNYELLKYSFRTSDWKTMLKFSVQLTFKEIKSKCKVKLKKLKR